MTTTPTEDPPGLVDSVRALAGNLLASLRDRVELLSLELQEEKLRLVQLFVWISLGIFAGVMALTFTTLVLVYLFWETARLAVLAAFALFYTGAAVGVLLTLRRVLARQTRPLAGTLEELEADRACIPTKS